MPAIEMYGPRCKFLRSDDGAIFKMLLDSFDEETQTSTIVTLILPREQLEEWSKVFEKALEVNT